MTRSGAVGPSRTVHVIGALLVVAALALTGCGDSTTSREHVEAADSYLSGGDARAAIIELKNALQKDPENASARFLLGSIYADGGDPKAAEKELRRALDLGVPHEQVAPYLARALLRQREYQAVLKEIRPLLENDGQGRAMVHVMRGHALRGLDREADGCASFEEALRREPQLAAALLGRALCAASARDYDRARGVLDGLLADSPDTMDAYLLLARVEQADGNHEQAIEVYDRALERKAGFTAAQVGKAELLLKQGAVDEAEAVVDQVLKRDAGHIPASHLKGVVLFQRNELRDAAVQFQDVLSRADYKPSTLWLGITEYAQGNMEQANHRLKDYLAEYPDAPIARLTHALVQARLGDASGAQSTLRHLSESEMDSAEMLAAVARAQLAVGDASGGTASLRGAVERNPDNPALRAALASAQTRNDQAGEAEAELRRLIASGGEGADTAEVLLIRNLMAQGRLDEARQRVDELIKRTPDRPALYVLRGAIEIQRGSTGEADAAFDAALERDEGNIAALYGKAMVAARRDELDAARAFYQRIHEARPGDQRALMALYAIARRQGDSEAASEWMRRAAEADPGNVAVMARHLGHLLGDRAVDKALETVETALAENPDNPVLLEAKGTALLMADRTDEAVDVFRRLTEVQPQSTAAWVMLGDLHVRTGDTGAARSALQEALRLAPGNAPVFRSLVQLELDAGNPERGIELAERFIEQAEGKAPGYLAKAEAQARAGSPEDALETLNEALQRVEGDDQQALAMARTRLLAGMDRRDQAINALADWVEANPEGVDARRELASLYLSLDQAGKAAIHYEAVLERRPEDVTALNNLAFIYTEQDPPRALELARRAARAAPDDPRVADTLGWALLANDQAAEALPLLETAKAQLSDVPSVRYHYAVALARTGDRQAAMRELDALLSERDEFAERSDARNLFRELRSQ